MVRPFLARAIKETLKIAASAIKRRPREAQRPKI